MSLAAQNAAIAVGWLGRTMIVIPEQEMVLVTFGSTWGSGPDCDSGSGICVGPWLTQPSETQPSEHGVVNELAV
eukprot:SAG31_NODE_370_length_16651_cov_3.511056_14_plen_74_part_00